MDNALKAPFLLLLVAVLLAGCQGFRPQTIPESIASAYVTIESLADVTASARDAGLLDAEQVAEVRSRLQQAKDLTDAALEAYRAGSEAEAEGSLSTALRILNSVSLSLEAYQ